jgi:hypothetical protein
MIASLAEDARVAVVLPNGCFPRGGAEQLVRRDLLEEDLVEAVVQLPKDVYPTNADLVIDEQTGALRHDHRGALEAPRSQSARASSAGPSS